ncbi:MAG TPA: 6-phosphogluconolactonase [Acidiferrobacterales bacterium]|nr:6-phosphogluconolactonase [Acidiferrobacterales bacterium]
MKSDGAPMTAALHWQVFADRAALAAHAAELILAGARAAIAARGVFRLVLAGGRTPLAVYARLASAHADWPHWHWYFGDERCLPAGDADRNDSAIRHAWLDHIAAPPANIHAIPAELGAQAAAQQYAALLAGLGEFDLVLLGLGADGHTASLFPGRPLAAGADVLAVHAAPKPPSERVTLSAARLSCARQVLFLVTGADKRAAVTAWRAGANIPARAIGGNVQVLLDAEAAAEEPSITGPR